MPRRPPLDIVIRRARPADRRAVREIAWTHDYVPEVFPRWVRDARQPLLVATVDDRVVGIGRLAWLGPGQAWLEGLRVHPRYRRRGVARALMAARLLLAVAGRARTAAYSTGDDNAPMVRAARRLGFRRAAAFATMRATARAGADASRRAKPTDIPAIDRVAREGWVHVGFGWRWRPLSVADIRSAVRLGHCYVAGEPIGAVVIADRPADRKGQLLVRYSAGSGAALRVLFEGLRASAARRRLDFVYAYASTSGSRRALERAGYRQPWSGLGLLFRKELR